MNSSERALGRKEKPILFCKLFSPVFEVGVRLSLLSFILPYSCQVRLGFWFSCFVYCFGHHSPSEAKGKKNKNCYFV